jgi:PmbA protein
VSSADRSPASVAELVERAVAMAEAAPDDAFCGLADPALLCRQPEDLELADASGEPSADRLIDWARTAEQAALAVAGVTNSEGADAGWSQTQVALATSDGFAGSYRSTHYSVSASVIAGSGTGMERDYDFAQARHLAELADPQDVGRPAGELAVRRLHPRKVASRSVPVVFAPRVANSLLGHLAGAISGPSVARGASFLKDRLHKQIFAPGVTITDDPHRRRGLRSKPFDGECVANRRLKIVEDGLLTTWLLDSASARQLHMTSTGHASRGTASPPSPSPSNFYLEPGAVTPQELMEDIADGFYVTELIGFGVNGVTGDYSRGAAGFWIESGAIAYPVSELTIAGNLKDMFAALRPACDLTFKYGTDSPTVRIDGMTVAGT